MIRRARAGRLWCGGEVSGARGRTCNPLPGGIGHQPAGTTTGARGAIAGLGSAGAGNTRPAKAATSQEAWPEVASKTTKVPLARAAVERRQSCAPRKGRGRARKARHNPHCVCRRFASEFYFFRSFPFVPFVIAGLDPAIHAENNACAVLPPALPGCNSAWTTGSSPVVTSQRAWRVIARALGRAARTRFYFRHHCARREIVNSYNPTPSDRACA